MFATFVGRPFSISSKICFLQIPLDLDDDQLALPSDELETLVHKLKNDSSSPMESMNRRFGYTKLSVSILVMREEILQLFLGPPRADVQHVIMDIASRSKRAWEERPLHSRYDPSLWETLRPVWKCRHLLGIWQEHMYNDFLVQRIMVQQLHADPEGLSELAYELLSGTLILVGPQSGEDISDLPWTIAYFCLPTAGVLALELLRQVRNRTVLNRTFSRSDVIQQLSVLVSALGWIVRPGEGNYLLLTQARKMLQRILNRVLRFDPVQVPNQVQNDSYAVPDLAGMLANDFAWLDNTDIDTMFWTNLEDHPLLLPTTESMGAA
ncbi:hypothetical protein H2203_002116 [Taxawa tesnikishii (nom. ined.)]|nr:hypothetical protein H2203_002116 [Dothideales sp. JES 119]